MATKGWSTIKPKVYDVYPYKSLSEHLPEKLKSTLSRAFQNPACSKAVSPITGYVPAPAYTAPKPNSNEFVLVSGKNCQTCSISNMFTEPTRYLGDRTVWINPEDAARLGIKNHEIVEIEGIDTKAKGRAAVTVTKSYSGSRLRIRILRRRENKELARS